MRGKGGLWMGITWAGLGIFLVISSWLGKASYPIPKLNIDLGWVVLALGFFRIWWWWKSVEQPRKRRLAFQAERRRLDAELAANIEAQKKKEAEITAEWLQEENEAKG